MFCSRNVESTRFRLRGSFGLLFGRHCLHLPILVQTERKSPMALAHFWKWLRRSRRLIRPASAPRRYRPQLDLLEDRCLLTVLSVTNTSDATVNPPAGSLRAQLNTASNGDEIVFDPSVFTTSPQTITLQSMLVIGKSITITGPGANLLTVTATGGFTNNPVISAAAGSGLTISGLKITGGSGNGGVGINNLGTLTVQDCWITGNDNTNGSGGGVYSRGPLTLLDSTVSGNTVTGAFGAYGAGIFLYSGKHTITNSTITGNTASATGTYNARGGGIEVYGNPGNTATITNSTIAFNTAQGPSTNTGGGIRIGSLGSMNLINSIVSNNIVQNGATNVGPNISNSVGAAQIPICLNNDVPDTSGSIGVAGSPGLQTGSPNLGPLQNNGGPTLYLRPGDRQRRHRQWDGESGRHVRGAVC